VEAIDTPRNDRDDCPGGNIMGKKPRRVKRLKRLKAERASGRAARAGQTRLTTHNVGVLPILNRILEQMKLEEFLQDYLPHEDGRTKVRSYRALMVLIRNTLTARAPI